MNKAALAKILGWGQLVLFAFNETVQAQGVPHGWGAWLRLLGSTAVALSVHHASSTDGTR